MKMLVVLIAVFFLLLAVSSPISALTPDLWLDDVYSQPENLEIMCIPSQFTILKPDLPLTENSRIGLVSGNVAKYNIKVNVRPGKYDNITLTNYVQEKSPWHTKADKNLVICQGML